jgi:hypothetical protein
MYDSENWLHGKGPEGASVSEPAPAEVEADADAPLVGFEPAPGDATEHPVNAVTPAISRIGMKTREEVMPRK